MKRRDFLTAMGLASGSLFLPSLLPRLVRADGTAPAKRVVFFFTQHGTWYDGWKMRQAGLAEDQSWEFSLSGLGANQFSDALKPLHAYRNRLLVLDGMAQVSAEADQSGLRHELAQVHALTGANCDLLSGLPLASAPSIDQRIADTIGRSDRWRSLELGVGDPPISVNYRGKMELLPFELNPRRLYSRIFGGIGGSGLSSREQIQRVHGSVLDKVRARYGALSGKLSAADRRKLETHQGLVRDLEQRVTGLATANCEAPEIPEGGSGYANDYDAFVKMVTTAFSCDLTRMVTLHMGQLPQDLVIPGQAGDLHDEHAHGVYSSATSQQVMTQYTAVHAQQFATLLAALDAVPEGNGTVLDNTLCVWLGEVADGAHGFEKWPVVMAGGDAFRMGRYIHWPSTTPFAGWRWDGQLTRMGVPHQKLLTSICQGMGVSINQMPVTHISGTDGARIDCTGPLDRLV